jgi:hypothetical protein
MRESGGKIVSDGVRDLRGGRDFAGKTGRSAQWAEFSFHGPVSSATFSVKA